MQHLVAEFELSEGSDQLDVFSWARYALVAGTEDRGDYAHAWCVGGFERVLLLHRLYCMDGMPVLYADTHKRRAYVVLFTATLESRSRFRV